MAHEVVLDVENVFHWNPGPEERRPDPARISYVRTCLESLAWWSEVHMGGEDGVSAQVAAFRGYGKLDPSGRAVTVCLLAGGGLARVNRIDEFPSGAAAAHTQELVLEVDFTRGVTATFTLVGPERHAAETALLENLPVPVASGKPHRIVLCSHDSKVTTFYGASREAFSAVYLLAYNKGKKQEHVGDPRVATFGELVSIYANLPRLAGRLVPGVEFTRALLTQLEILLRPAPPSRPRRRRRGAPAAPRPVASPVETLRRVRWKDVLGHAVDSPQWVNAWGDSAFQQTVSRVIARDLRAIMAVNDELASCIEGLLRGDPDEALVAYRAFALIAVHYRLREVQRESLGAALRSDPELSKTFWRPYVLVQPYLARPGSGELARDQRIS